MGLLRSLAHTIFGFLLLTTLWVTALSFLSMRPAATAVITDLGVDTLNPWLVSKHIGLDPAAYDKLQQAASANPGKPLTLTFIKPQIIGSDIKGLPYAQGVRLIYSRVADAYYDGGPSATFNLPAPVASAVQTFALFPEQYDTLVKSSPLPTWLQPFLLFTGLSPETLTAVGHARIVGILSKFWIAALLFAGAIVLLNLLSRKNPVQSLAQTVWHSAWPVLALFGVLWLLGTLYPTRVQPVSAAFGVVAGAFAPVYGVAAGAGLAVYLLSRLVGALAHSGAKARKPQQAPAIERVPELRGSSSNGGYSMYTDKTPAYMPGSPDAPTTPRYQSPQPPTAPYGQRAGQQPAGWTPPPRESWERQPAPPTWNATPPSPRDPRDPRHPTWNQPRAWDAPNPDAEPGGGWDNTQSTGPNDPTSPRW